MHTITQKARAIFIRDASRRFPSKMTSTCSPCSDMSNETRFARPYAKLPRTGSSGACGGECLATRRVEQSLVTGRFHALGCGSQLSIATKMRRNSKRCVAVSRRVARTVRMILSLSQQQDFSLNTRSARGGVHESQNNELRRCVPFAYPLCLCRLS